MKLDTAKDGINRVWKDYQSETIQFLIEKGEEGSGSGDVYAHVLFQLSHRGMTISRASIIQFLNRLVEDGLATWRDTTGKGGHAKIYSLVDRTLSAFNDSVIDKLLYSLWETFPENARIAKAISL